MAEVDATKVEDLPSESSGDDISTASEADLEESIKYRYKMDSLKKGKCVIINMETFDPSQKLDNRKGTDKDANSLKEVFESLGFTVQIKKNATHQEIVEVLNEAAQPDASQWSCFVFVVLSHGEEGRFHCFDDIVEVENLFSKFRECKGLVGKPKLFFFQACRGEKRDCGVTTYSTAVKKNEYKIPVEADFLCHYSTPLGYVAYRNPEKGSCFIQTLCEMLKKYSKKYELLQILTRVNHSVAFHYVASIEHQWKEMPCFVSTLTKDLYL